MIGKANIDMLCVRSYNPSCDMTKCTLSVPIDRERQCIFPLYIELQRKQLVRLTKVSGTRDVFGFEGCHGDEMLLW